MRVFFFFYFFLLCFRERHCCKHCSFTSMSKPALDRHEAELHDKMARCGFGCSFVFPLRRKCLLRDHHKKCHKGLPHRDPIIDGKAKCNDITTCPPVREERSRSPLRELSDDDGPPRTPGRSFEEEEDEFLVNFDDPLGLENPESPPKEDTVSATPPRIVGEATAGSTDTVERGTSPVCWNPTSPAKPDLGWKLIPVDIPDFSRPIYKDFLSKPDRYTTYLLSADPRFKCLI